MELKGLFLLFVGISVVTGLKTKCPPKFTLPCHCVNVLWGPTIKCTGSDFAKHDAMVIHDAIKEYKMSRLTLSKVDFPFADENLLKDLNVEFLVFDRVTLEKPLKEGVNYLEDLAKNLRILEISHCYKTGAGLLNLRLDYLNRLETFIIVGSVITEIGNNWFPTGPNHLHTLLLEDNKIERLGDKAFNSLQGLHELRISGSDLGEILRSMLPSPAPELEKLDLSSNRLEKLPNDLFTDMPALVTVSINNNLIKTLSEEIWPANLRDIASLKLHNNPLQCDSDLRWVCNVNANTKEAVCDSPEDKKGIILSGFCDTKLS